MDYLKLAADLARAHRSVTMLPKAPQQHEIATEVKLRAERDRYRDECQRAQIECSGVIVERDRLREINRELVAALTLAHDHIEAAVVGWAHGGKYGTAEVLRASSAALAKAKEVTP
jgi:hypothetical protein